MTAFNVNLEYPIRVDHLANLEDTIDRLMTDLASYGAAIGGSPRGRLTVRLTFAADDVEQASRTAVLAAGAALRDAGFEAANREAVILEAMTEREFDAREGFEHVPELVSANEAAATLGVSRMRVNQMIDEGWFSTAQQVGATWAIALREVEQNVALVVPAELGITEEDMRAVASGLYDSLRTVGIVRAFKEAQKANAGDEHNEAIAQAWWDAEVDALQHLALLHYNTDGVRLAVEKVGRRPA